MGSCGIVLGTDRDQEGQCLELAIGCGVLGNGYYALGFCHVRQGCCGGAKPVLLCAGMGLRGSGLCLSKGNYHGCLCMPGKRSLLWDGHRHEDNDNTHGGGTLWW